MTISVLKPFVPSGKDFATARRFFVDLGFSVSWEHGGCREVHLIDPAGVCWHFA
jgi:hypothetical protein